VQNDWEQLESAHNVSAGAATTAAGHQALDDAAGKPEFVWLHYFDVTTIHQINR